MLVRIEYNIVEISQSLDTGDRMLHGKLSLQAVVDNESWQVYTGMYRRDRSAAETRIDFHNHKPSVIEVADKLDGHSTAQTCDIESAFHKFYRRPVLNGYCIDNLASGYIAAHSRTDGYDKPAAYTDIAVDGDFLTPVYALLNQIFGSIKTGKVILTINKYNAFRGGATARFGDELAYRDGIMICRWNRKMLRFKECSSLYFVEHQL